MFAVAWAVYRVIYSRVYNACSWKCVVKYPDEKSPKILHGGHNLAFFLSPLRWIPWESSKAIPVPTFHMCMTGRLNENHNTFWGRQTCVAIEAIEILRYVMCGFQNYQCSVVYLWCTLDFISQFKVSGKLEC